MFALQSTLSPITRQEEQKEDYSLCNQKNPNSTIEHDYHDHANDPIELPTLSSRNPFVKSPPDIRPSTPFPQKLFFMLMELEDEGLSHLASWQPHGRCFLVHKPDDFTEHLPRFFKLSKITSFQRQLNLYGFSRLSKGADRGAYYNEYFLRGRSDLLNKILRVRVKGTGVRGKSNPDQEPDFWKMEWVIVPSCEGQSCRRDNSQGGLSTRTIENHVKLRGSDTAVCEERSVLCIGNHEGGGDDDDDDDDDDEKDSHELCPLSASLLELIDNTNSLHVPINFSTSDAEYALWGMPFHWDEKDDDHEKSKANSYNQSSKYKADTEDKEQSLSSTHLLEIRQDNDHDEFADIDEIIFEMGANSDFWDALTFFFT